MLHEKIDFIYLLVYIHKVELNEIDLQSTCGE